MKPTAFISVKLTIALILGILISYCLSIAPFLAMGIFGSCLLVLLGLLRFNKTRSSAVYGFMAIMTAIGLGILSLSLSQPRNMTAHYSKSVVADSSLWVFQVHEVLKASEYSNRYILKVLSVDGNKVGGKVLGSISRDSPGPLEVDDILLSRGQVNPILPPSNPAQFGYDAYMEKLGVYDQIRLEPNTFIHVKNGPVTPHGWASHWRNQLLSQLRPVIAPAELGVVQALLLGQRNDLDTALYNDYKNAGAVHILAVSGLHIGIILLILQFLLRPLEALPKGKSMAMAAVLLLLWGYAFFTGLSPSVVRAVTMFSFLTYALYLNRPTSIFNIMALSMFFILVVNPLFLFQAGFQMSYAAVFAIVWIYPLLQRFWRPRSWLLKKGWQLLSVSLAAQVGVLPISLYYFQQFPGLFFITNLLIVPFMGIILGVGLLVMVLAAFQSLPLSLAASYNTLIKAMNTVVHWVAQQDDFIFDRISIDLLTLVLLYLLLYFLITGLVEKTFKPILRLSLCVLALQLWLLYDAYSTTTKESFMILHQTANTALLHQTGRTLTIMAADRERIKPLAANISLKNRIEKEQYLPIPHAFTLGQQSWVVLDSTGVYPPKMETPPHLLLSQSPRINMERLLDSMQPLVVIADGSNYKSFVARWKESCKIRQIPFHSTSEDGAFIRQLQP